jgi:2-polyprenyl-3-methyl-5-hydroxy-6-metoxy-1,4-benzoquinol methylase
VNIVECAACIFAWQFPLARTETESVDYFDDSYADEGNTGSAYFDVERKREITKLELGFVESLRAGGRTLLDIGAGAGIFAEVAAAAGWDVTAVDPALDRERLADVRGVEAVRGTTRDLAPERRFDVVTAWDVVEHLADPLELLAAARDRLVDGGWLVLETGNYKSAARVAEGTSHWIYQLDHRWYFAPDSIRSIMAASGFTDLVVADTVFRPAWRGVTEYAGPSPLGLVKSMVKHPFAVGAHLRRHSRLRAARSWERSGIDIFTIAGRRVAERGR